MHIIIRKHELYYKRVNFIVEELELMSIREKHTDKMEEILEKEMYADEGFSEIDEEDQRPETQKVMKQERRQQRKNRRKNWKLRNAAATIAAASGASDMFSFFMVLICFINEKNTISDYQNYYYNICYHCLQHLAFSLIITESRIHFLHPAPFYSRTLPHSCFFHITLPARNV